MVSDTTIDGEETFFLRKSGFYINFSGFFFPSTGYNISDRRCLYPVLWQVQDKRSTCEDVNGTSGGQTG